MGGYYGFFPSACLFCDSPRPLKKQLFISSVWQPKACNQSFIIYDAANDQGGHKKQIFALLKALAGPPDNGPINFVGCNLNTRPWFRSKLCLCVTVKNKVAWAKIASGHVVLLTMTWIPHPTSPASIPLPFPSPAVVSICALFKGNAQNPTWKMILTVKKKKPEPSTRPSVVWNIL